MQTINQKLQLHVFRQPSLAVHLRHSVLFVALVDDMLTLGPAARVDGAISKRDLKSKGSVTPVGGTSFQALERADVLYVQRGIRNDNPIPRRC